MYENGWGVRQDYVVEADRRRQEARFSLAGESEAERQDGRKTPEPLSEEEDR
jgi:hypothetical protein